MKRTILAGLMLAGSVACKDVAEPVGDTAAAAGLPGHPPTYGSWSAPVELPPSVNAPGSDTRNAFETANGQFLYYASVRDDGFGGRDIYASPWLAGAHTWGAGINLGAAINTDLDDFHGENHPNLSAGDHWLYFSSARSSSCAGGDVSRDLYVAYRRNPADPTSWEPATNLGCSVNTPDIETAPAFFLNPITHSAQLFFMSDRPGGLGQLDIWVSARQTDGSWGVPADLAALSSEFDDNKIAIRSDGLEAFISSDRPTTPDGEPGAYNTWTSTRRSVTAAWSAPTLVVEGFGLPNLSADGTRLYVTSGTIEDPGLAGIYVMTRSVDRRPTSDALADAGGMGE